MTRLKVNQLILSFLPNGLDVSLHCTIKTVGDMLGFVHHLQITQWSVKELVYYLPEIIVCSQIGQKL